MNINDLFDPNEKPLDNLVSDGGFCGIFRKIGCIGDSLSSGEFEGVSPEGNRTYHDFYDYSWGQYLARMAGCTVYNFSKGGMTAKEYILNFAQANGFWDHDKACQAYIIALGVNDLCNQGQELGTMEDIDFRNYKNNKPTFTGYYARIIQAYKRIQPDAKFFLMTMPSHGPNDPKDEIRAAHAQRLYDLAEAFENCYVLDLRQYGPVYDEKFREKFYLHGHMNPSGYIFTAKIIDSYIDYIVRHNPEDFRNTAFINR